MFYRRPHLSSVFLSVLSHISSNDITNITASAEFRTGVIAKAITLMHVITLIVQCVFGKQEVGFLFRNSHKHFDVIHASKKTTRMADTI